MADARKLEQPKAIGGNPTEINETVTEESEFDFNEEFKQFNSPGGPDEKAEIFPNSEAKPLFQDSQKKADQNVAEQKDPIPSEEVKDEDEEE